MKDEIEINGEIYKKVNGCEPIEDFQDWEIGESYHIETYTKYYTGRVVGQTETHLLLKEACYIASTGKFSEYVKGALPKEAEPFNPESILRVRKDSEVCSLKRELILEQI